MGTRRIKEKLDQRIHEHELEPLPNRAREITRGVMRQNEERYMNILESIEEGYFELDLKGTFAFVNNAACALMGYECDELIGMNYKTYTSPETARRMYGVFHRIFETGKPEIMVDYEVIRKDGSVRIHEMNASLLRDTLGKPMGFRVLVWDLTESKREEDVVRKREERYRNILDSMEEAYFEVDLKGNLTFFNFTAVKRLGYSNEEIMGMNFHQFVDDENARKVFNAYHKVFLTGETIKAFEWEFINKHGEKIAVEASVSLLRDEIGSPIGFRGVVRDISDRKKAEAAQRDSEERFRDLANLLPETVFEIDKGGRFTFLNQSSLERFGYSQDEITRGVNFLDVIVPEDHERVVLNYFKYITGENYGLNEYTARKKNGSTFPVLAHSTLVYHDGEPAGIRGFLIDITEKKNIEQQLVRAQKMEAIGTLAGGIAHDFNNLLMGILGNVSLMLMNFGESHPLFSRLKSMEEYVQRGSELTKQLLGFARGGKYEVKPTDLGEFVRKSSELFGRTKKEICIHLKDQKGLWTVEVDRGQMEQVFLNLYINAWQAMPSGGDLYISTENVELGEMDVSPYDIKPGKFVKIIVTDTGIGMDEATKARVFEPFFTTRERERGTGLGLASAYGIIKNHGGFINVESEKDLGSSFIIYLPASEKTEVEDDFTTEDEIQKGQENVLLIDDEKMVLDVGSKMLEGLGHRVITAIGGKQGLQIYEKDRDLIDLVILDMIMPDLSGKETFDTLQRINPSVKVLLSSGYSLDGQAREIMQCGCKGFIQKPYTMVELSKKIRGILDE